MGILSKIVKKSYVPAISGHPGYPARRGTRDRWYVDVRNPTIVCKLRLPDGVEFDYSGGITLTNGRVTSGGYGVGYNSMLQIKYSCIATLEPQFYPGISALPAVPYVEATPSRINYERQLGWNSRDTVRYPMAGDGVYMFNVPTNVVGCMIGLTRAPQPTGYRDIEFGMYITGGSATIYESGQVVASAGAASGTQFSITRVGSVIQYRVGGALLYSRPSAPGNMSLSAALYAGGDEVIDAEIEPMDDGVFDGYMSAPKAFGSESARVFAELTMRAPTAGGAIYATASGRATMPAMRAFSTTYGVEYSACYINFDPITAGGEAYDIVPSYAIADFESLTPDAYGDMLTGGIMSGSFTMRKMFAHGSQGEWTQGRVEPPNLIAYGNGTEAADEAMIYSNVFSLTDTAAETELFVVLDSSMTIQGLFTIQAEGMAELLASIGVSGSMTTQQVLQALIHSVLQSLSQTSEAGQALTVWALNMDTGNSTRYEQYDFNSFAEIDGRYYGAKTDGIYLLEGATDAGQDVAASVDFGRLNFGTLARKALPYLYAGVASNGKLVLKVTADGQTYLYNVRDNTELLKAHRFELGRGLRASYYDITLMNEGGTAFDVSSIEFYPLELSRRL